MCDAGSWRELELRGEQFDGDLLGEGMTVMWVRARNSSGSIRSWTACVMACFASAEAAVARAHSGPATTLARATEDEASVCRLVVCEVFGEVAPCGRELSERELPAMLAARLCL